MIFITIEEADTILGDSWATQDKKAMAVNQANVWLGTKKFCKSLDPMPDAIKQAGAYLAQLSAQGLLYVSQKEGAVTEKTVSAQSGTSVSKKYAAGEEKGKSAEMLFIDDLLKPYLCSGAGLINTVVCK